MKTDSKEPPSVRSFVLPAAINLPPRMIATLLQSFSATSSTCVEKLCNKVAIIKDGDLIKTGDMEEIVKDGTSLEDIFMEVVCDE